MAEPEKKQPVKDDNQPKAESRDTAKVDDKTKTAVQSKMGIFTWIIMFAVVLVFAGSGFFLGHIFAGVSAEPNEIKEESAAAKPEKKSAHGAKAEKKSGHGKKEAVQTGPVVKGPNDVWYYSDLESVVVNPDEPGATRYVRVGLNLEFTGEFMPEQAAELINAKKPLLINWLNLYFKSLTLAQMQNDRDIKRILANICDAFNEILFPESKPQIRKILIREFNIQ